MSKREWTAALLQTAGMVTGASAGWLVSHALGLAVAGVSLVVSGVAVERRN